jgi:hypothetical protein
MAIPSAPATSPAMAAGRGSPNPMPAGLSALLKPDAASRGKPVESMEKLFNVAKDLPDSVLADVLAGRSLQVPQYLAMLVATGRKNLRTAMQGVQARAQMQQPSVKDKLMAEEAVSPMMGQPMQGQMPVMAAEGGLASLPAPNMDSVDMADGGIIAFDDGGEVQHFQNKGEVEGEPEFGTPEYDKKYGAAGSLKRKLKGALDYYASPSSMEGVGRNITNTMTAAAPLSFGIGSPSATGQIIPKTGGMFTKAADFGRRLIGTSGAANAVLSDGNALPVPDTMPDVALPKPDEKKSAAPSPADALKGGKDGGGGGTSISGMPSYEDLLKRRSTDYLSKFEGMGDKKRKEIDQLKQAGLGQFLMNISQGLLSKPGLAQGISAGLPGAIQTAAESRKEQLGRADIADQYDFNIAKAREASERGDMQSALQYAQLANQNNYQMRMADMYDRRNAIMSETGNLGKVQLGLKNADTQAYNEAKTRFANMPMNKKNQAAFDDYVRRRAQQLKMENPLTKQYASLGAGDLGSPNFNVVQSLPKGASVIDPEA